MSTDKPRPPESGERAFSVIVGQMRLESIERSKRAVSGLRFHPSHAKVPGMPDEEFAVLVESVKAQGVQIPVEILGKRDVRDSEVRQRGPYY